MPRKPETNVIDATKQLKDARSKRLAQALRENLKRRKAGVSAQMAMRPATDAPRP